MLSFKFPLPPTVNHYYGRRGNRTFIKKEGMKYRLAVQDIVTVAGNQMLMGRLRVFIAIHPANRIRQDIDNRLKCLLDSCTLAGVWEDDSQIDDLHIVRHDVIKGGRVVMIVTEIQE
jgi:crossover junction endodeoxyribonuclease RusA